VDAFVHAFVHVYFAYTMGSVPLCAYTPVYIGVQLLDISDCMLARCGRERWRKIKENVKC